MAKKKHKLPKKQTAKSPGKRVPTWWKNKIVWLLTGIALITFIAYLPSLNNGFTNWDDQEYVTENHNITEFTPEKIKAIFTEPVVGNMHPVTMLSLAANFAISQLDAFSYHLVNLFIHIANTLLVFWLIYLFTKGNWLISGIVALLFGIHPMHVESVAWIAERKDVLYAFFFLWALVVYYQYIQPENSQKRKTGLYVGIILLALLSLLSKPAAVVLPVVMLLIDWFLGRKWHWNVIVEKLPFFALSIWIGLVTVGLQSDAGVSKIDAFTLWERIMFAGYSFTTYIWKVFLPIQLSTLHPFPKANQTMPLIFTLSPFIAAAIVGATAWSWRKTKVVVFGMLFYLITIALVLQFITVGISIVSERYTYIPYIGLFFIVAVGFDFFIKKQVSQNAKYALFAVLGVYCLAMAFLTFERCKVWENGETLWSDVIQKYPKAAVAYGNRGNVRSDNKELDKAKEDFLQAIKLKPNYHEAYGGLGTIYRKQGKYPQAIDYYNQGLAIKPDYPNALNNRGSTYYDMGKDGLALADFEKVIQLDEGMYQTYGNMGSVYGRQGNYKKAVEYFNESIAMNPQYGDAYLNRAILYTLTKEYETADRDYKMYQRITPTNQASKLYYWRGVNNIHLKRFNPALQDLNRAVQGNPNVADYYLYRSRAYKGLGDKAKALQDARKARNMGSQVEQNYIDSLK